MKTAKASKKTSMATAKRNPLIPRMEYVAKTYDAWVTMAALGAWAEATGEHRIREDLADEYRGSMQPKETILEELKTLHRRRDGMGMDTRFDRYLPWVAREFNRMWKFRLKAAGSEHQKEVFTAHMNMDTMRIHYASGFQAGLTALQRGEVNALANEVLALRNSFRVIVDWAEAEKVDLNKVQWPQALSESHAWGANRPAEDVTQGKVVYRFDDGWTVQELRGAEQLRLEGEAMQHCVGSYEGQVGSGRVRIFSLRDPKGHPHATMEWDPKNQYVEQIKGKQNASPKPEYLGRMVRFRMDMLPSTLVRKIEKPDFGLVGDFKDPYLGTWATRQSDAPKEEERTVVVYERESDETWEAIDVDDLHAVIEKAETDILDTYALPDDEEERDRVLHEYVKNWVRDTSLWRSKKVLVSELRPRRDRKSSWEPGHEPALDFAVWESTGAIAYRLDDEMVKEIAEGPSHFRNNFVPRPQSSAAANPRGRKAPRSSGALSDLRLKLKPARSSMESLKRKLMR